MAGGNEIFKNCAGGFGFFEGIVFKQTIDYAGLGKNMPEGLARIQVVIQGFFKQGRQC